MDALAPVYDESATNWKGRLRHTWRRCDPFLLLLICLPFIILAFHRGWIFTIPASLDGWYSVGYYLDLRENIRFTKDYYASGRLACWLPGALVYKVFPPLLANYVLRMGYYLAATLAFYATTKHTLGRKTALTATFALGCYWQFLTEIGWHYVDGAGITYTLLAFAALAWAADGRRRGLWMAVAGFWFAAGVFSNLTLAMMAIPLAFFHLCSCRCCGRVHLLGRDTICAAIGFLALAAPLAAFFYRATHTFILGPSIAFGMRNLQADPNRSTVTEMGFEKPPFLQWFHDARWLDLPLVVLAGSLVYLLLRRFTKNKDERPFGVIYQGCYLLLFALWAILQSRWMNVLVVPYYASYLIPVLFLALAAQIQRTVEALRHSTVVVLSLAGVWLMADLFRTPPDQGKFHKMCLSTLADYHHVLYLLGTTLAALLAVVVCGATRWRAAKGASLAFLLACFAFLNYTRSLSDPVPAQVRKDAYRAIMDGVAMIRSHGYKTSSLQFWYKPQDWPDMCLYWPLHSVFIWHYSVYSRDFPEMPRGPDGQPIAPSRRILVVLSKQPGAFADALPVLRRVAVEARLVEEKRIVYGSCAYTVTLIENRPLIAQGTQP